jgi:hypothetical protein
LHSEEDTVPAASAQHMAAGVPFLFGQLITSTAILLINDPVYDIKDKMVKKERDDRYTDITGTKQR